MWFCVIRNAARGCTIAVTVGKDDEITLPRVSGTHANIIGTPIRNLPPCRHVHRLVAIFDMSAIINSAHMQRRVEVAAVALGNAGYRV